MIACPCSSIFLLLCVSIIQTQDPAPDARTSRLLGLVCFNVGILWCQVSIRYPSTYERFGSAGSQNLMNFDFELCKDIDAIVISKIEGPSKSIQALDTDGM